MKSIKQLICLALALSTLLLLLTACGGQGKQGGKSSGDASPAATESNAPVGDGVVHGIVNRIDDYLVLLVGAGEYLAMDLGEGVTLDSFEEGDEVDVTYTGDLEAEEILPVAIAITKTD